MMPRAPLLVLVSLAVALATGCAGSGDAAAEGGDSGYGGPATSTTGTGDTGTTTAPNNPTWFTIEGSLTVENEEIDLGLSTLEMDYRNDENASICSGIRPLLDATLLPGPDPDVPTFGWWTLTLDASPCGAFGPDEVALGIGAWDGQLDAAAAAQNLDGAQLYAMYVQLAPTEPILVFGAAGTSEQFSGTTPPVDAGPLPDGVYQLRTLYLLNVGSP